MPIESELGRRDLFKAGAALLLGFCFPSRSRAGENVKINAWIHITRDSEITLLTEVPELGQGTRTAAAMMLAEELEADWSTIRVEQAPTIPHIYKNLATGGSGGTAAAWLPMRRAGAQARDQKRMPCE